MAPRKIRPLTKALFEANTERLTKRGYRLEEQRQVFKKVDMLLDYIAEYTALSVTQKSGMDISSLKSELETGLRVHLSQGMPSLKKQELALEILSTLLSMGQEMMVRAAWLYRNYPLIFKNNYASSIQAYQKDSYLFMMPGHTVPTNSFISFKTGENPVFSHDNDFSKRCIQMYTDSLFESPKFLEYEKAPKTEKDYYIRWLHSTKAGKHFGDVDYVLSHDIIPNLSLKNAIELKMDKTLTNQAIRRKKQKTK